MPVSQKVKKVVTPAKAGVHNYLFSMDSRLRGNDREKKETFYDFVNLVIWLCFKMNHR